MKVLCQLKQYSEADKARLLLEHKEKEEHGKLEEYILSIIGKDLDKVKGKHIAQMNVLMSRVQRDRNEQRKHK